MKCLISFISFCFLTTVAAQFPTLDDYNVVWNTPSLNSAGSMPCGGGDIGLNIWVENGDLLFYFSRSGTFDENNAMLKQGRVRLRFSSNPFQGKNFRQELKLREGYVSVAGNGTQVNLWVDVFRPVIHITVNNSKAANVTVAYENWRFKDHIVTGKELRGNSYKAKQLFPVITYKDEITFNNNNILFYHRNRNDNVFDYTVKMEKMSEVKGQLFNPLKNLTFGGSLQAPGMVAAGTDTGTYMGTAFQSWMLKTKGDVRTQQIEIGLHVAQSETVEQWKAGLQAIVKDAANNKKTAWTKTRLWWQQFWNRSFVFTGDKADSVQTMARNYQLFRYMLACNAYGAYPTKFNGGLFTFDPVFVDTQYYSSPDFRLWGGGTMTAQNQRLVYFPMFKNGDFDFLQSQFNFYLRTLKNAELRSKVYWNHGGASFTEQIENFGFPNVTEYNPKRPEGYDPGVEYNAWLEHQWETVFEFCLMMLETERYEGRDIKEYIPFIESCLQFYDEHYQYMAGKLGAKIWDENGKYVFYPTSAAETYKMAYNSTTVIAALQVILSRLLELPVLTNAQRERWSTMLSRIPELPIRQLDGHTMLAPAKAWARIQNREAPQLYPVYPWGLYGKFKPGLDTALNTWLYDPQVVKYRSHVGWMQYNIFAPRLGLTQEAAQLNTAKFANGRHRFPAFWGPGFDWTPDHNWGGSAMIGVQEMLMQVDDKKIYLLPAWPMNWNVHFKLHAPYNTTVEVLLKDGKMEKLMVVPESRKKDVIFPYIYQLSN